jgi:hypothetical protein
MLEIFTKGWSLHKVSKKDLIIVVSSLIIYAGVFAPTIIHFGMELRSLTLIPVILVGWFLGMKYGIISAFLVFIYQFSLSFIILGVDATLPLLEQSVIAGISLAVVGGLIGKLNDVGNEYKAELELRRKAEADLQIAKIDLEKRKAILDEVGFDLNRFTSIKAELEACKLIEGQLKNREQVLRTISKASENFLKGDRTDEEIQEVLAEMGKVLGVSDLYIFKNTKEKGEIIAEYLYEWTAEGVERSIDNPLFKRFSYQKSGFERWETALRKNEVIQGKVSDFPEKEREVLSMNGTKSILNVPIFVEGKWWGQIGLVDKINERIWSDEDIEVIKTFAGIIAGYFHRIEMEKTLHLRTKESEAISQNLMGRELRMIELKKELDTVKKELGAK